MDIMKNIHIFAYYQNLLINAIKNAFIKEKLENVKRIVFWKLFILKSIIALKYIYAMRNAI